MEVCVSAQIQPVGSVFSRQVAQGCIELISRICQSLCNIQQVGSWNLIFLHIWRTTGLTFAQSRAWATCYTTLWLHTIIYLSSKKFWSLLFRKRWQMQDWCPTHTPDGLFRKCQVLKWVDVSCCSRSTQDRNVANYVVSFQLTKHYVPIPWWNSEIHSK